MIDPLGDILGYLQPKPMIPTTVGGRLPWQTQHGAGRDIHLIIALDGFGWLEIDRRKALLIEAGDIIVVPADRPFVLGHVDAGQMIVNDIDDIGAMILTPHDDRILVCPFRLDGFEPNLVKLLLPDLVQLTANATTATLISLINAELQGRIALQEAALASLLQIMLMTALRAPPSRDNAAGVAKALTDQRLTRTLRQIHEHPSSGWTIQDLAGAAEMSRSVYFERFNRAMGLAPMEYVLTWRMALAKALLKTHDMSIDEVARRVGYSSGQTFSTAFSRREGISPVSFARRNSLHLEVYAGA